MKALKIISDTKVLEKFTNYVNDALVPVIGSKIIDGFVLKNIELTTGITNSVPHKLNRELLGWIIISKNANSQIWDSQAQNVFKNKTLDLNCSANVTINLWVF